MVDETIPEKCETLYNKLNSFVESEISRDVTPQISNLNSRINALEPNLLRVKEVNGNTTSISAGGTSSQTFTVPACPSEYIWKYFSTSTGWGTVSSVSLSGTTLTVTMLNVSNSSHDISFRGVLVYYPKTMEAEPHITVSATNPYMLSGETTDLVVSLVNAFGSPLSGKTVTISDGTSVYNGITDNNGTYTKTGVSVTDDTTFTATYGTETASCLVEYCSFVDYGTSTKHNDNWVNYNSNMIVTRNDMYTTLTPTVNSSQNRYEVPTVPNQPFVIEFDKHNTSVSGSYIIIGNNTIQFSSSFSGRLASAKHLKFTIQDNKLICEHDGVVEQAQLDVTSLTYIRFQINNTDDGNIIQYKNFRIR